MEALKKPFKSIDEQIEILKERGMSFASEEDAKKKLLNNNYYTVINGYSRPFMEKGSDPERYKRGTSFDEVFALYEFDSQLRALLLKYILRIEHQLKSVIAHVFSGRYKDIPYPDYLDKAFFDVENSEKRLKLYNDLLEHIDKELEHQENNNNKMLLHYKERYDNIPPWILMSFLSFGMMRTFYCCLKNQDQNEIARKFNLYPDELYVYLSALNTFRNSCAHDERIYNLILQNSIVRKDGNNNKIKYNRVYIVVLILKDMLDASTFMAFHSDLESIIYNLANHLSTISIENVLYAMGMPVDAEVRKKEMGALEIGDTLSEKEYGEVIKHYILPIIPFPTSLVSVKKNDKNRSNPRCKLVEYKKPNLYFAQNKVGNFIYYVKISNEQIIEDQLSIIEEHLSTLIDYIHIFWNLSNLSAPGRERVEVAFPKLCEQAYEITICNLLCQKESLSLSIERSEKELQYKREQGKGVKLDLEKLKQHIQNLTEQYEKAVKIETVAQKSLYNILNRIEEWAYKTYEGQKKTFGIIFCHKDFPKSQDSFDYIDFLKSDFSATINDGLYSAVELYADGAFKKHISITYRNNSKLPSIPYPFTGFAELCTRDKTGILLTESGDILVISNQKLQYTKHNGFWLRSNADKVIKQLMCELDVKEYDVVATLYQTITDLSYSRGGACIGIINDDHLPSALHDMIDNGLLSNENNDIKMKAIKSLIKSNESVTKQKTFYKINRHLRRELLELDGAVVISKSGLIHVIGTIIKLKNSGSSGGGRTAAAKQLSNFGIAIKISQDGYVQIFKQGKVILEILT